MTSAGLDMIDVENQRAKTKKNPLYTQDSSKWIYYQSIRKSDGKCN